jgi:nitrous oxide reductase accessory protein NosL
VWPLADAQHSLRDAELAAAGRGGRVTRFEDFDLTTFMVSEIARHPWRPSRGRRA